jgi:hypothetical protein
MSSLTEGQDAVRKRVLSQLANEVEEIVEGMRSALQRGDDGDLRRLIGEQVDIWKFAKAVRSL